VVDLSLDTLVEPGISGRRKRRLSEPSVLLHRMEDTTPRLVPDLPSEFPVDPVFFLH